MSPVRKPSIKAYYYESAQIKLFVDSMPGIVATRAPRFNCQAVIAKPSLSLDTYMVTYIVLIDAQISH